MADLSLRDNNPYSIGSVFVFNPDTGEASLDRNKLVYVKGIYDKYHTVMESETLWILADRYYSNSKYYWVIADINNIDLAIDLEVGTTLLIPDLTKIKVSNI